LSFPAAETIHHYVKQEPGRAGQRGSFLPQLAWAIELLFDPPAGTPPLHDRRQARTIDKGHGRSAEVRRLLAPTDLTGYLDCPGVAQVFRVERTWREDGRPKQQIRYGITSLPAERGPAGRLLDLKRKHWMIENRLHRSKDVTLGEDASLIHAGQGPSVFAMLRDTALSLLRRAGCHAITARRRYHSQYPEEAIALLLHPPPAHV